MQKIFHASGSSRVAFCPTPFLRLRVYNHELTLKTIMNVINCDKEIKTIAHEDSGMKAAKFF
jgi:hypothetical protein